jgi:hypothetical protein
LALALATVTACGSAPAASPSSGTPSVQQSRASEPSAAGARDERGHGLVRLSEADDGRTVLVDIGQLVELTIGGSTSDWVPPYLAGPRGTTGQDRVLYLQQVTGYPAPGPAHARLRAGNPGDAVVASHRARCGSSCPASDAFTVRIRVGIP